MVSTVSAGYTLTVEELSAIRSDNTKESFFFLTSVPSYSRDMSLDINSSRRYNLTERESQVADLIIKGMPNKLIADQLSLSMSTVKNHTSNIFRKLQVHSRMGVVEKLSK